MTNLAKERTRRAIGRQVVYCPYCLDKPLSFRDDRPFCRTCSLFGKAFGGAEYNHSNQNKKGR